MYIAVCDDNVADRKQLERLLGRESEKRKNDTGVFYVNSFGHASKLLAAPMQYDLFFIDVCDEEQNGLAIAKELIRLGVTVPIVLCSSHINYQEEMQKENFVSSLILHLAKSIKVAELSSLLDSVIASMENVVPTIELRGEHETRYVHPEELCYAENVSHGVCVHLSDDSTIVLVTTLSNLFGQLSAFPEFTYLSGNVFTNIAYVRKLSLFKAELKSGNTYTVLPPFYFFVKKIYQAYQNYLASKN